MWRTASAIATSRLWRTHRREPLLGRGELDEVERAAVLVEPRHRRADAELDAPHRVGLVADRGLLAPAQVLVRAAEQLDEQLLLAREVPVEDALADAEARDDVGDRRGVVAPLGEEARRLRAGSATAGPCPAASASAASASRYERLDRAVKNRPTGRGRRAPVQAIVSARFACRDPTRVSELARNRRVASRMAVDVPRRCPMTQLDSTVSATGVQRARQRRCAWPTSLDELAASAGRVEHARCSLALDGQRLPVAAAPRRRRRPDRSARRPRRRGSQSGARRR